MTALSYCTRANVKTRLGITDTDSDSLLDTIVGQVNDYIEFEARRPIGPNNGGTAIFDASRDVFDDELYVPWGIRSLTSLTVAPSTGAAAVSATVDDVLILPRDHSRRSGWPGHFLRFKDSVTGAVSDFGSGDAGITVVGNFGFESIPPVVTELAEVLAVRTWHARQTGQADEVGSEEGGEPTVTRYLSARDRRTLRSFRPAGGLVAG